MLNYLFQTPWKRIYCAVCCCLLVITVVFPSAWVGQCACYNSLFSRSIQTKEGRELSPKQQKQTAPTCCSLVWRRVAVPERHSSPINTQEDSKWAVYGFISFFSVFYFLKKLKTWLWSSERTVFLLQATAVFVISQEKRWCHIRQGTNQDSATTDSECDDRSE